MKKEIVELEMLLNNHHFFYFLKETNVQYKSYNFEVFFIELVTLNKYYISIEISSIFYSIEINIQDYIKIEDELKNSSRRDHVYNTLEENLELLEYVYMIKNKEVQNKQEHEESEKIKQLNKKNNLQWDII